MAGMHLAPNETRDQLQFSRVLALLHSVVMHCVCNFSRSLCIASAVRAQKKRGLHGVLPQTVLSRTLIMVSFTVTY